MQHLKALLKLRENEGESPTEQAGWPKLPAGVMKYRGVTIVTFEQLMAYLEKIQHYFANTPHDGGYRDDDGDPYNPNKYNAMAVEATIKRMNEVWKSHTSMYANPHKYVFELTDDYEDSSKYFRRQIQDNLRGWDFKKGVIYGSQYNHHVICGTIVEDDDDNYGPPKPGHVVWNMVYMHDREIEPVPAKE